MSEPYTPGMITALLREMPAERLSAVRPVDFQRWPTRQIVPGKLILELISNEAARRSRHG